MNIPNAGQQSFLLLLPLPLGRLRAGLQPHGILVITQGSLQSGWAASSDRVGGNQLPVHKIVRRYFPDSAGSTGTSSAIYRNLSGFHSILQGLFMPFTFHVVKCTNSSWDKPRYAAIKSLLFIASCNHRKW